MNIELVMDYGYTDLAVSQCDAGVRYRDQISEGMNAMRFGPDERMVCVGAPDYFEKAGVPQTPQDLTDHRCINLRLSTHGALYAWEFEDRDGHEINVKAKGQACFNTINPVLNAADRHQTLMKTRHELGGQSGHYGVPRKSVIQVCHETL